jgi:CheY-like chemotaxis protein/KaiC/GvpD/RAD55 family RecA-like ATPase
VLAIQIVAAALRDDDIVAFLSAEPAPLLLRQAASLGIDLEEAVTSEQLVLLELDPRAAASLHAAGGRALIEAILAEHPSISLIVIDPCTALTCEMLDEAPLRAVAREWIAATPRSKLVLTVETDRPGLDAPVERVLAEVCGSFLSLARGPDGRRTLTVDKTRAGAGSADAVEFRIGERGAELVREIRAEAPPRAKESAPPAPPLPTAAAEPLSEPNPAPAPSRARGAAPVTILVVASDEPFRTLIEEWLEGRYTVASAADGFEAMALLFERRPDLIVLDLAVSRISGYEVLSAFHRVAEAIPVLAVADRLERSGDRLGPIVLGAAEVLPRPFQRFDLLHKIETLLRLRGAPPRLIDPEDARALFGSTSPTRLLPAAEFRDRLRRVREFGEQFGVASTLVAISASSAEELDRLVGVSDAALRFEDAMLLVSKRRALMLLVAAEEQQAPLVVERLAARLAEEASTVGTLPWRAHDAAAADGMGDWRALFSDLQQWPGGASA